MLSVQAHVELVERMKKRDAGHCVGAVGMAGLRLDWQLPSSPPPPHAGASVAGIPRGTRSTCERRGHFLTLTNHKYGSPASADRQRRQLLRTQTSAHTWKRLPAHLLCCYGTRAVASWETGVWGGGGGPEAKNKFVYFSLADFRPLY